MQPIELAAYLKVLRDAGCMTAKVVLDGRAEFSVAFEPGTQPLPGMAPEPGGWKSPPRLDAAFEDATP